MSHVDPVSTALCTVRVQPHPSYVWVSINTYFLSGSMHAYRFGPSKHCLSYDEAMAQVSKFLRPYFRDEIRGTSTGIE